MIFLIITLICAWMIYIGCKKDNDGMVGVGIIFAVICSFVSMIIILEGIGTYPRLVGEREYAISLRSEIEQIRGAHYFQIEGGRFVGGSFDNMKQSTNLSDYIKKYADYKSRYNSNLRCKQAVKNTFMYKVVGNACFISDKAMNLKPIE